MRFDRVRLRNFKPYADADLDLRDGVTVIHGLNGSGKSSLLEACFFALYGSKTLDGTLEDVVTNGTEESEIELWFTHDGAEYRIERRLRRSGDRTSTAKCVLEGPEGEVEGARDVRRFVADLLRMDHEAFVNCAYVRQGEVNKLINATPRQRQDMIDDLLQLGKLEAYRERAGEARLGVEDVLGTQRGALESLESQIEEKEADEPHQRLNELQSRLTRVVSGEKGIEHFEGQRRKAEQARDEAESVLEAHEEKRAELDEIAAQVEELESTVEETEGERERLREQVRETRERVGELRTRLDERVAATALDAADADAIEARRADLDEREAGLREDRQEVRDRATMFANQADRLRERAEEAETRVDEKRERAADLDEQVEEARAERERREESLAELDEELATHRSAFDDAPVDLGEAADHRESLRADLADLREEKTDVAGDRQSAADRVAEAERLLAEGKCPECGQPVEDSPHVDSLEADRERVAELEAELDRLREREEELESQVDDAEELLAAEKRIAELRDNRGMFEERIEEKATEIAEKREEAERLREAADEHETEAAEKREVAAEKAAEAEAADERVAELDAALEELSTARDRLDRVEETLDAIADAEDRLDRLRTERENKAELNDERRGRLADLRERRDDLRADVDEERVERARERKRNAVGYLEQVEEELEELREERDRLQSAVGGVKQDISQLEDLRGEREDVAERVDALESLHAETEELEAMYGDLRAELRQRNVESLERMLNETFDLVYGNDAYSHIELDGEYELTVYQKDGQPLEPEQLSGGERALFNLSLRCAIYRLLAEGIEGAAPTPPLILDEPTVFLDAGHVSRLVDLVEEMRGFGVRQIIIVSHDDELVGAADDLVTVEKDGTTNRSTVSHEDTSGLAQLEAMVGDD